MDYDWIDHVLLVIGLVFALLAAGIAVMIICWGMGWVEPPKQTTTVCIGEEAVKHCEG